MQTALRCPRLFHYRYVERLAEPEIMPEARVGKAIHSAMEHVLMGTPLFDASVHARQSLRTKLEEKRFDAIQPGIGIFVDHVDEFRRIHHIERQLIEYRLGIREDGATTTFYAGDAFFRGILDVGFLFDDDQLAVIDHKTGQPSRRHSLFEQLEGYAVLTAACFGQVRHLWLGIYWVATAHLQWAEPVQPDVIHGELLPKVLNNIEAAALAVADGPRTNTGVWCERCSYRTVCPAGREMRYEPVESADSDDDYEPRL